MSKVVEKVKVTNFKDPSKSIEIEAVIDTGATMSVLPMDLIQKLGLEKIDEVNVYADNSVKRKEVYGWVILEIAGRKACLLYTSPSPRDLSTSRMPSSA